MSRHDDTNRLRHMLDHAREAVQLLEGKSREELEKTRLLQLGLVRLTEIIGEAAARVSEETRTNHSTIPWRDLIGTRNKLIHGYDSVDIGILWDTAAHDLPALVGELEQIVEAEDGN